MLRRETEKRYDKNHLSENELRFVLVSKNAIKQNKNAQKHGECLIPVLSFGTAEADMADAQRSIIIPAPSLLIFSKTEPLFEKWPVWIETYSDLCVDGQWIRGEGTRCRELAR